MADVEQMKKIVPFVTCEITFGQNVCELMFGVNVPNLNLGVQINSVKQSIQSNSVGFLKHVSLWDFGLYYHLDHGFIVLKNKEHGPKSRRLRFRQNIINITQLKIVVLRSSVWSWVYLFDVMSRNKFPRAGPLVFFDWFGEE